MSGYDQWGQPQQQPGGNQYNFDIPDFGQELNFQSFDNTPTNYNDQSGTGGGMPPVATASYDNQYYGNDNAYTGQVFTPAPLPMDPSGKSFGASASGGGPTNFDDEPPLLEELGINPQHIIQKTLSVLNPLRSTDQSILQDTDLAGPLVFILAFGAFLLLRGKVTFSYIYGIGVMGCIAFYCLLSLMASQAKVTLGAVISVLGYCLLPMVMLCAVTLLITIQGTLGMIVSGMCILWCSVSASKLFATAYSMDHQQILVAYPCALFYGVFALITIF